MCGHVKYVLNSFILSAQLYIDTSVNKYQIHTPTSNVMDSIHSLCFSFIFKEREGEKSLAPPPLHSRDPITTSLPCSHSSGDFSEQYGSGVFLAQTYWAYGVTLTTEWHLHASRGEFATEQVCKEIICTTASLNQKVRGVSILDLNVCGKLTSKQIAHIVSKVDNPGVCHQCHAWNKCRVLCSHHRLLHAGDQDTWLGVKLGFYCCRRPEQVSLDPLCVQAGFFPSLPALSCKQPKRDVLLRSRHCYHLGAAPKHSTIWNHHLACKG